MTCHPSTYLSKPTLPRAACPRGPLRRLGLAASLLCAGLLIGCSSNETVFPDDDNRRRPGGTNAYSDTSDTIFGPGGLLSFDSAAVGNEAGAGAGGGGIGVNSYLWRASLDTISFMPLATADPFGGVIITDWYAPPEALEERFKVNVYILDRDLRADGLRAAVFRQTQDPAGQWIDAAVDAQTATDLENAILDRARQLRIASLQ